MDAKQSMSESYQNVQNFGGANINQFGVWATEWHRSSQLFVRRSVDVVAFIKLEMENWT